MKRLIFYMTFFAGLQGWAQVDTSYLSDWEFINLNYRSLIHQYPQKEFLDYSSGIERDYIKSFRTDSLVSSDSIVADDWIGIYHSFQTKSRTTNYEDSTFVFTKKVYDDWNINTYANDRLTLPIGVIFQHGEFIKDKAYGTDLIFSQSQSDYGWNLSNGADLNTLIESHDYFCAAVLFDEVLFDQELTLTFDTNYTVLSSKEINNIYLEIEGNNYILFPGKSINLFLKSTTSSIRIGVNFSDSTYLDNVQLIETDTSYFEENEKSALFTGGIHNYPELGNSISLDLTPDIIETIITSPEGLNLRYKLHYGIIWGDCNTTGKLRKPIFMLHGFRPTVQPINPSLRKLYRKKFNFKGTDYGDDGFVDLLVKNGFDVVICRMDPGYQSIRLGARLLSDFFENVVEPQKLSVNSKHENIVLGFSMGGHYWRNILMYDEYEHLNLNANRHHHTRMWIPVDSPLHGANNPLAHQFAAKSIAEHTAGFPVLNIAYNNMLSAGSQEQQRYDVNGINGFDGAPHRFHTYRTNYINEMENTFYLGETLTKYKGFPSATRNIAVSVGSNSLNYYDESPHNVPVNTYHQNSSFPFFFSTKHWEIDLRRAFYNSTNPALVFKRKIYKVATFGGGVNILVDDHFEMLNWFQSDNGRGSYLNSVKNNVNNALNWNSLLGFGAERYKDDIVFVPTLSSLAINPRFWPSDMRYNLKTQGLLFYSFDLNPQTGIGNYGYPHLGRPSDFRQITPMNAIFCNENTYEHITLIEDANNQNDQSELITFLLNEIQPWYLDLQNQNLGEYARSDFEYTAKYEAKNVIRTGTNISPKTPFGDYVVKANANIELQAGEEIHLLPGTHIENGAEAHLYIKELCYAPLHGKKGENSNESSDNNENTISNQSHPPLEETLFTVYPNPNDGTFYIELKNNLSGNLTLYNLQGAIIGQWNVTNGSKISLSNQDIDNSMILGLLLTSDNQLLRTKICLR